MIGDQFERSLQRFNLLLHFHDECHEAVGNYSLNPVNLDRAAFEFSGIVQIRLHGFIMPPNGKRMFAVALFLDEEMRRISLLNPDESPFGRPSAPCARSVQWRDRKKKNEKK